MTSAIRQRLDAITEQIEAHVPLFAAQFGLDCSLEGHAEHLRPVEVSPIHARRQEELAAAVRNALGKAFGSSRGVWVSGADLRAVNVADHHQLLNHPALLGTNVISGAARLGAGGRPIVVFSCSSVAPNNGFMDRGFSFCGRQIPYFSSRERHDVIYCLDVRRFDFVDRLQRSRKWTDFNAGEQRFLQHYENALNHLDCSHARFHRDQLSVAVHHTWPTLFAPEIRHEIPPLLYANVEDVGCEGLRDLLLQENFLADALLEPRFRRKVIDSFRGVVTAWDESRERGTHFFWRKHPNRPRLLRMWCEGDALVPTDPRFAHLAVPLERNTLVEHLVDEKIVPSIVTWMSLVLYSGVTPLVGPNSLLCATQLRNRWAALLLERGLKQEASLMSSIDTTGLIAGAPIFFTRTGNDVHPLYAADLIFMGGVSRSYLEKALSIPFRDVLRVGACDIYRLFAGSLIPVEGVPSAPLSYGEAASVVHDWI